MAARGSMSLNSKHSCLTLRILQSRSILPAALAKRVLETELVRLEETATDTADDTWTSHIKTLEWLLKLPTMSLTIDTFKSVLTDANLELIQLFLKLTDVDPSADDNYAIR